MTCGVFFARIFSHPDSRNTSHTVGHGISPCHAAHAARRLYCRSGISPYPEDLLYMLLLYYISTSRAVCQVYGGQEGCFYNDRPRCGGRIWLIYFLCRIIIIIIRRLFEIWVKIMRRKVSVFYFLVEVYPFGFFKNVNFFVQPVHNPLTCLVPNNQMG